MHSYWVSVCRPTRPVIIAVAMAYLVQLLIISQVPSHQYSQPVSPAHKLMLHALSAAEQSRLYLHFPAAIQAFKGRGWGVWLWGPCALHIHRKQVVQSLLGGMAGGIHHHCGPTQRCKQQKPICWLAALTDHCQTLGSSRHGPTYTHSFMSTQCNKHTLHGQNLLNQHCQA